MAESELRSRLLQGLVIPAMPLALNAARKLDERRQRALCRYYIAAGAGGLAVAVHTTQFAIRRPNVGLLEPVLAIAAEEMDRASQPLVRIGGVIGLARQAVSEAQSLRQHGYQAALLSLAALKDAGDDALIAHCRAVADVMPLVGFYLQPDVGGRILNYAFWRRFAEIDNVVAIKLAPFNRYRTLDVIRAVADSGRADIAVYTGNDDNIVADLLTPFVVGGSSGRDKPRRIVGGLLGQWAVWTRNAVEMHKQCHVAAESGLRVTELLQAGAQLTDANAAIFDSANGFRGCIAGIHEVLRRQGLLEGTWCLDPAEQLSDGQPEEIERVCRAYPHLGDDAFVAEHRDQWLRG